MGKSAVAFIMVFLLVSCGGGGSSAPAPGAGNVSPYDGAYLDGGSAVEFSLSGSEAYRIILYNDSAATEALEESPVLYVDEAGNVKWTPETKLSDNRPYWWRWFVIAPDDIPRQEMLDSDLLLFRVKKKSAVSAISPRDGGSMDVNLLSSPRLAVFNFYTHDDAGVSIEYDFELYSDPEGTNLLESGQAIAQTGDEIYTAWTIPAPVPAPEATLDDTPVEGTGDSATAEPSGVTLVKDVTYYWRARAIVDGDDMGWMSMNSFTVKNVCDIQGSTTAEHVTEWTQVRECNNIIRTDTSNALGWPDAYGHVDQANPGWGFVSIDLSGILGVEIGRTVANWYGADIRIYEWISTEPIELFAGLSEIGPWRSLGIRWCGIFCDWDLGAAGMSYARFFRIKDRWSLDQTNACYETAGADIDAVIGLHSVANSNQCGG